MGKVQRALLVCGSMAALGAVVGQHLKQVHWLLTILIPVLFGTAGYIGFDVRAFWQAVSSTVTRAFALRSDTAFWRAVLSVYLNGIVIFSWVPVISISIYVFGWRADLLEILIVSLIMVPVGALTVLFIELESLSTAAAKSDTVSFAREFARVCNPLKVLFWHLPRGLFMLLRWVPAGLRAISRFFTYLFMLLHTEHQQRMIWLLSVGLGTATGELLWHSVPAAAIGFAVGGGLAALDTGLLWDRLHPRAMAYVAAYRARRNSQFDTVNR